MYVFGSVGQLPWLPLKDNGLSTGVVDRVVPQLSAPCLLQQPPRYFKCHVCHTRTPTCYSSVPPPFLLSSSTSTIILGRPTYCWYRAKCPDPRTSVLLQTRDGPLLFSKESVTLSHAVRVIV